MKHGLMTLALAAGVFAAGLVCWMHWNHRPVAAQQHGEEEGATSHSADEAGLNHVEDAAHEGHAEEQVVVLSDEQMKANGVEVAAAGPGELSVLLALSGEVQLNADRVAHVVPRVPGVVREVFKNIGDDVKAGDVMAVLDSRELAILKANYLAAREREELARSTFERERGLWEKMISAEQDFLSAKQVLAEAAINTRSAEQQLHAVGLPEEYLKSLSGQAHVSYTRYEITAPFDGSVIEKHITLGESLREDASCFTIADLSTVWINLNVYQKDLPAISAGQEVAVSTGAEPSGGVHGLIEYLSPVMGEDTRTTVARLVLPNEAGQWRPGQFVTGFVSTERMPVAVLIPKTALQILEKATSVFVETNEGFVPTPVTVGRSTDTCVEIVTGLAVGQRYAVTGSFIMKAMLEKGEAQHAH